MTEKLFRKAKNGTLEVEHLLDAAQKPSLALAEEIDRLITEFGWPEFSTFPEVPWFAWATIVTTFCRQGYKGLICLGLDCRHLPFVVGLISELRDPNALSALVRLLPYYAAATSEAHLLAAGFNLLGMRLPSSSVTTSDQTSICEFLHSVLKFSKNDAQRGTALCALRYFGDTSSLVAIKSVPAMSEEWEPTRVSAKRAIQRRMRSASV